jgi:DNA-binding GntR family transcriptional regulator
MPFDPVDTASKRDQVLAAVRGAILRGELRPGERIVELRLGRELGVSQTPVREALSALAREGLVQKLDHRGTFVSSLDRRELLEALGLRALLEGYCARLACPRITSSDLETLRRIVEEMTAAAEDGDLARVTEIDFRFHAAVYELSGHRLLGEVLASLQQRMRLALAVADAVYAPDLAAIADSHLPLLTTLASGDPEQAEAAARDHVLAGLASLRDDEAESEPGPSSRAG